MKKIIIILLVAILLLAGCTSSATNEVEPCEITGTSEITLVTDTGGVNDESFNQGTWEAIEAYCTTNTSVGAKYIETTDAAQMENNLKTASEQSEVVVVSGSSFATPVYNVAPLYPDVHYVLIDAEPTDANSQTQTLDNVMSFYFAEEQAGYLAGYVAGKTTKTNHIGFIGGEPVPGVNKYAYGFVQGAQEANPDIIIDVQYADSFADQTKGQTMADAMYGSGCDIIFQAAGGTGLGVINSAVQRAQQGEEVWVIGVDLDQYSKGTYVNGSGEEKSVILTSATKNLEVAVQTGLDAHFNNTWDGGSVDTLSIEDNAVGFPTENPNMEPSVIDEAYKSLDENKANISNDLETTNENITTATINGELR